MKKIISILLSVLMLAGCFIALIPTANAKNEDIKTPSVVPSVTKGELVYSEDFEGEGFYDAEGTVLSGADLLTALGWSGTIKGQNSLEVVEETENRAVLLRAYGTNVSLTFLDNELLAGGDYIVEYTHILKDNRGDKEGSFGIVTGGSASNNACTDTVVSAMVEEQGATNIELGFPGQKKSEQTTEFYDFARENKRYKTGENDELNKNRLTGSSYQDTIRFRFVLDNVFGPSMWILGENDEWTLIAYANMDENIGSLNWQKNTTAIKSDIAFSIVKGMAVQLDDVAVYKIQREGEALPGFTSFEQPSLIISEVVAKGTEGNAWLELYNAGTTAVNLYDYAIAREEGVAVNNLYSGTVDEQEVCYILPGENTVTGNGQTATFVNPAYEDGILLPGDAAVLYIPVDRFHPTAPMSGTVEGFVVTDLIESYGMTEAQIEKLKLFTICSAYNFGLGTNTNDLLAVTPVDAETKIAKVIGHNITDHDYVVSLSADFKAGKNTYVAFDGVGCNGYTPKALFSNEIIFIDEKNTYVGHGLIDARLRADSSKETMATPGCLPLKNTKKLHMVTMTGMLFEEDVTDQIYLNTEYVPCIIPADSLTKKFAGWMDESGNIVQTVEAVHEKTEDIVLVAVYEDEIPELAGYQVTQVEDGKYDLRIVATVDRLDTVAFGMKINYKYFNGIKNVYGSNEYYCHFVYEEISQNYGAGTVSADAYGANYFAVFHIEDCPADIAVEYTVTTFAVFEDETGLRTTVWSEDSMVFSPIV